MLAAESLSVEQFYETIRSSGLDYGDKFQGIKQLWHRGHDTLARVELAEDWCGSGAQPVSSSPVRRLPSRDVRRSHCNGDPAGSSCRCGWSGSAFTAGRRGPSGPYVRVSRNDEQYLCSDTLIFDDKGELVAEVIGLTCKRLAGSGSRSGRYVL